MHVKTTCGKDVTAAAFDYAPLEPYLQRYRNVKGSLIPLLQKAQEIYGYLPQEAMVYISRRMNIKPAEVYGVATFYSQFRLQPAGKYLILLCQGTACHVNGSQLIEEAINEILGIQEGETTADGLFTLNNVACLGCCSLSPVMMINGETYGNLTKDKVAQILRSLRAEAVEEVSL